MTIGLSHFGQGVNGFGHGSQSDLEALSKALEAGYDIVNQQNGSALRVESLESSLKVVTYTASHIKFWKKIPKSPAYSTVEEYNELSDYGGHASPWVAEGALPQKSDSTYARRTKLIKFLGTVREVTHQASVIHPAHGDLIAQYNQEGILWLLQQIERGLFEGDSSLAFNGESEEWDGLDASIDARNVIDLQGSSLTDADIEEASNMIIENYGFPTDMFLGVREMSDLTKTLYPRQRIGMPAPANGKIGMTVSSMSTQGGDIELNPDVFVRVNPSPRAVASSGEAPATPASVTGAVDTTATLGDFNKAAPAGTNYYAYVVTAGNAKGESAPTAPMVSAVTITQGEKDAGNTIELTITNAAVIGTSFPEYYSIYRTKVSSGSAVPSDLGAYSRIARIPAASQAASGTTTFADMNFILPFTSTAYLGELTPSVLTFRQLMPMMKMDLAVLGPAYRWMILLYGSPVLFAPRKWTRIINVGALSAR